MRRVRLRAVPRSWCGCSTRHEWPNQSRPTRLSRSRSPSCHVRPCSALVAAAYCGSTLFNYSPRFRKANRFRGASRRWRGPRRHFGCAAITALRFVASKPFDGPRALARSQTSRHFDARLVSPSNNIHVSRSSNQARGSATRDRRRDETDSPVLRPH